jgi:hypothetical protein
MGIREPIATAAEIYKYVKEPRRARPEMLFSEWSARNAQQIDGAIGCIC